MLGNGVTKFRVWPKRQKRQRVGDERSDTMTVANALRMKENGRVEEALATLLHVMSSRNGEAGLARYELALYQLQLGRHEAADANLAALQFNYRLNNAIFSPSPSHSKGPPCASVKALDNALPEEMLRALQHAFAADSLFFTEHNYPTPGFFSYTLPPRSSSGANQKSQETLMHQVIAHLRPLIEAAFPQKLADHELRSVEFWAHARDGRSAFAHQLHWDLDESALRDKKMAHSAHPAVSSVLYLSDHASAPFGARSGAPTLVTDQTLDAESVASEAWLCWPAENRLLMFDGALLHGVAPYFAPGDGAGKCTTTAPPRISLMLGWWARTFPAASSTSGASFGGRLGPNMPLPRAADAVRCRWMKDFCPVPPPPQSSKGSSRLQPTAALLTHVPGPIWVPVAGAKGDEEEGGGDSDGAVAFISKEELAALRAGAAPAPREKAKADLGEEDIFVGKWFLRRLSEVRDDVVC